MYIMPCSTHFHSQILGYLRQYSNYCDLRHLKALAWMVSALICSGQLSLPAWEPYVQSSAQKAQSFVSDGGDFLAINELVLKGCICHW